MNPSSERPALSIVCVFNDEFVRANCLDKSILGREDSTRLEYIPVDNVSGRFSTAGAALNHGAALARGDVVVFVHQDVFLHSLPSLRKGAEVLQSGQWGMLGASGVTSDGRTVGRMRDRVVLTGINASMPIEVDSLDEVLFMVDRQQIIEHPLSEDRELSWHAYAVEYGLRLRSRGIRTGAMNLSITHNSLTENLAKLDVAHQFLARKFPHHAPVRTTCGIVGAPPSRLPSWGALGTQRWRYRWLRESAVAWRVRSASGSTSAVLADMRLDVDLLRDVVTEPLRILNLDTAGGFEASEPLELFRAGWRIDVRTVTEPSQVVDELSVTESGQSILVTNIDLDGIQSFAEKVPVSQRDWIVGYHEGTGIWLLAGVRTGDIPRQWSTARAIPLRMQSMQRLLKRTQPPNNAGGEQLRRSWALSGAEQRDPQPDP